MRNLRREAEPTATLFSYVCRVGSVTIKRCSLRLLAQDLNVRVRDLDSLIERMTALGQVRAHGDVLQFSVRRQCVAKLGHFFPRVLRSMKVAA